MGNTIIKSKEWKIRKVEDVADINLLSIGKDYEHKNIEYVDISSVEGRKILFKNNLMLRDAPSRAKRIVRDNDILISTVRPNLEHFCFIKEAENNLIASTGFAVVSSKEKEVYPYFLYYLLTTNTYTRKLTSIADGHTSTYPTFNSDVIEKSTFLFPELDEQKEIADVLSSLDDKIELLQKQNETLENVAQAIFNEWFVDFNFPNKEGKPYKKSGGRMVDSELREIPEGWEVKKLEELCTIRNGFAFKSEDYVARGIPIVRTTNFTDKTIHLKDPVFLAEDKSQEYTDYFLERFDILIVMVGASVGKNVIVPSHILPALQNQNMWNFKPKSGDLKFYSVFLVKKIIKEQLNSVGGSARDFFRKDHFYNLDVIEPDKDSMNRFSEGVGCIFKKIDNNLSQIEVLQRSRDALLPKLMSGELRVDI